jgi:glutathione peroxidase
MKKLKKILIVILLIIIAFWGYVEIVNRNSKNMSLRQKILKAVYPAFSAFKKMTGKGGKIVANESKIVPPSSLYHLSVELNNGDTFSLAELKGKKILIVNTASDCGYTPQYDDLQKLYEQNKDKLTVLGFPANNFKAQEKGTDEEIAQFCKINYGITFPLVKKSSVIKNEDQNEVFKWLTDKNKNGWNDRSPAWNFSKYLVDEHGVLVNYFGPAVSPLNEDVLKAIQQ